MLGRGISLCVGVFCFVSGYIFRFRQHVVLMLLLLLPEMPIHVSLLQPQAQRRGKQGFVGFRELVGF